MKDNPPEFMRKPGALSLRVSVRDYIPHRQTDKEAAV